MNRNNKNSDDELMRALSEEHIKALSDEYNSLPDDEPDFPRSNDWINSFIEKRVSDSVETEGTSERGKLYFFGKRQAKISRVAALIIVIVLIGSGLGLSSEAVRLHFFNLFTDSNEEFTRITSGEDTDLVQFIQENWKGAYYLSLIPENYHLVGANEINDLKQITYKYQDYVIIFRQDENSVSLQLDTEDADTESLLIEGMSAIYSEKNNIRQLHWIGNDGISFLLTTNDNNIDQSDMISLAKSLQRIK